MTRVIRSKGLYSREVNSFQPSTAKPSRAHTGGILLVVALRMSCTAQAGSERYVCVTPRLAWLLCVHIPFTGVSMLQCVGCQGSRRGCHQACTDDARQLGY